MVSEPSNLTLLLELPNVTKAGVAYQVECWSSVTGNITELAMWLNVGGKHHQLLTNTSNEDTKSTYVYAMSLITFNKTDNQKEVSCGAKWRNKTYTSDSKKINILCKYSNMLTLHM